MDPKMIGKVGAEIMGKKPMGGAILAALGKKKESMDSDMDSEMDSLDPASLLKKTMAAKDGPEKDSMIEELIDQLQTMKSDGGESESKDAEDEAEVSPKSPIE